MSQVWSDHKDAANKALEAKDWEAAIKEWQGALDEAEKFAKGDGRLVTALEGLAQVQFLKGNHAESENGNRLFRFIIHTALLMFFL